MTDDLVRRLRDLAEEWFEMCGDIHEPLYEASDRIEAQAAEIERLRVEAEAHYDRGYYDGSTHPIVRHDALREDVIEIVGKATTKLRIANIDKHECKDAVWAAYDQAAVDCYNEILAALEQSK